MKDNKKNLMILTDLKMGGVTTSAVNFCNGLCERGAQVDVLVMSDYPNGAECAFSKKIRILHLNGIFKLWNLDPEMVRRTKNILKKVWYLFLGMIKKIANKKKLWTKLLFRDKKLFKGYDVVIAYRQCQPCYYVALHNVEAKKKIAFVHGDLSFMGDVSTWLPLALDFDSVAYVSNAVKDGFVQKYPELKKNAITVYNTFLTKEILCQSRRPCDTSFDCGKINLITVSRIENTMKGTGRIAPVCKLLKEKYPGKFHWYIVGDGPDLETCKAQSDALEVSDHLTYLGMRTNPFNLLSQADICVFTTFTEAFPMIVGECLIVGTPIVTTRYPAVTEMIEDGKHGLIAEQSEASIFEKLSKLFDNQKLLNDMKNNCLLYEYDNDRSYRQFGEAVG